MPTKIRLQRHGKKSYAFYHIVIADSRAPRDGKFIEKIGTYNPNTNPATIDLDFDRAFYWYQTGAQPTDTCKAILSYRGILMKDHLYRGVTKGALTQEQADAKFEKWLGDKSGLITGKIERLASEKGKSLSAQLKAEAASAKARADKKAAQNAPVAEETPAAEEAASTEETPAE